MPPVIGGGAALPATTIGAAMPAVIVIGRVTGPPAAPWLGPPAVAAGVLVAGVEVAGQPTLPGTHCVPIGGELSAGGAGSSEQPTPCSTTMNDNTMRSSTRRMTKPP